MAGYPGITGTGMIFSFFQPVHDDTHKDHIINTQHHFQDYQYNKTDDAFWM